MSDERDSHRPSRPEDQQDRHVEHNRPPASVRGRTSRPGSPSVPQGAGHNEGRNERSDASRRSGRRSQSSQSQRDAVGDRRGDRTRDNSRESSRDGRDSRNGRHSSGNEQARAGGRDPNMPSPSRPNGPRRGASWDDPVVSAGQTPRAWRSWDDEEFGGASDRTPQRDGWDDGAVRGSGMRNQRPASAADRRGERRRVLDERDSARAQDAWEGDGLGRASHERGGGGQWSHSGWDEDELYGQGDLNDEREWQQWADWVRRGGRAPRVGTLWGPGAADVLADWKETSQRWAATQQHRFFSTKRGRITTIVLLVCLAMSVLAGIPTTVSAAGLVRDSLQHLKAAEADAKVVSKSPFDTKTIAAMRGELVAAHDDFSQLNGRLQAVPGMLQVIPIAGSKLAGAQRLLPIAVEGTRAGIIACDALTILTSALKNPLDPKAKGLTPQEAAQLAQNVDQVVTIFNTIVPQVNALQPSDLSFDPRLGPAIAGFKTQLPKIVQIVQAAQVMAHLAPTLLGVGQPTNYLVEVLDSTELRPGGGFIGNYGILTLAGGRLDSLHIQDVDLLDAGTKYGDLNIPLPKNYTWFSSLYTRWGFRDSNLDADFPTAAQNGEQLYVKEMKATGQTPVPVQGVIAITPWLIQNAMKITGPIEVVDYPKPGQKVMVTPDNLISKIHFYALGTYTGSDTQYDPRSGSSLRKRFTGLLFQAFMAKMKQDLSGHFSKYAQLFTDSLHSKDVQIYLNQKPVQAVLQQFTFASAIQAPASGDSLFEVDANIGGSKANYVLKYSLSDQITLDAAGTATHHLAISYTWPTDPRLLQEIYAAGINNRYHGYSRVYVPPNAALLSEKVDVIALPSQCMPPYQYVPPDAALVSAQGWANLATLSEFGRKVFAGQTLAYCGKTTTISLTWKVPHAAAHDATGWHYHLLFQKQAGITWPMTVQVSLPTCAAIQGTPQGFTSTSAHGVSVKEPLANDVQFAVDYTHC